MNITPEILRKLQLILLDGLLEIKRICEKHKIQFFLVGGSLIGAVRHKGFIPWDEDIDIGMTRKNFEKFCQIAPAELSKKYFLQTPFTDSQCFGYGMARIRFEGTKFIDIGEKESSVHNGFYIDIFPLDNTSDSKISGCFNFYLFNLLVRVYMYRNKQRPWLKKRFKRFILYIGVILFMPLSKKTIKNILENFHIKQEKKTTKYIILMRGRWGYHKEKHLRENISEIIELPFESVSMPVPAKYHEYLTEQYGDYMTLPPENKRLPHHKFELDFGNYLTQNEIDFQKKNIIIDCRMIDFSGVGSYLQGIIPYFINSNNNITLIGAAVKIKSYFPDIDIPVIECNTPLFSIRELFFFSPKILKIINSCDIYFTPFFNVPSGIKIPIYTTIHDIIFPDIKKTFSKIGVFTRMFFYRRAYKKSKKIFTVSEFSKSRIIHHLGNKKPVIVTHESINTKFKEYNNKNIQKEKNVIFIGNIKKHKGLNCLIDAFMQAKKEGLPHKLYIIGNMKKLRTTDNKVLKKIKNLNCDSIIITGYISGEELIEKLSKASLLVNPSLYEGFGLPPLEALVLGTNVLLSDIPAFKEIYGEFPVTFFKTGDSADLKNKLMELLYKKPPSVPALNKKLLNKYTFEKTASVILGEIR